MTITELLNHVGDENIAVQNLQGSLARVINDRTQSRIAFYAPLDKGHDLKIAIVNETKTKFVGLIVWLPRDKLPEDLQ